MADQRYANEQVYEAPGAAVEASAAPKPEKPKGGRVTSISIEVADNDGVTVRCTKESGRGGNAYPSGDTSTEVFGDKESAVMKVADLLGVGGQQASPAPDAPSAAPPAPPAPRPAPRQMPRPAMLEDE